MIYVLAILLAVVLGGTSGMTLGPTAGVLAALAGLLPPTIMAVAVEKRRQNAEFKKREYDLLKDFAPPKPMGERREGE